MQNKHNHHHHRFDPVHDHELNAILGGGGGPWSLEGVLGGGSRTGPLGAIDLSYHFPKTTITGSVVSNGHDYATGLGVKGRLGPQGGWSGNFTTDGHNFEIKGSISIKF